jgi:hypothetical protein
VWFPAARHVKRRVAGSRAEQAAGPVSTVVGSPRQQRQADPEIDEADGAQPGDPSRRATKLPVAADYSSNVSRTTHVI